MSDNKGPWGSGDIEAAKAAALEKARATSMDMLLPRECHLITDYLTVYHPVIGRYMDDKASQLKFRGDMKKYKQQFGDDLYGVVEMIAAKGLPFSNAEVKKNIDAIGAGKPVVGSMIMASTGDPAGRHKAVELYTQGERAERSLRAKDAIQQEWLEDTAGVHEDADVKALLERGWEIIDKAKGQNKIPMARNLATALEETLTMLAGGELEAEIQRLMAKKVAAMQAKFKGGR